MLLQSGVERANARLSDELLRRCAAMLTGPGLLGHLQKQSTDVVGWWAKRGQAVTELGASSEGRVSCPGYARGVEMWTGRKTLYNSDRCDVLFGILKFKRWRGSAKRGEAKGSEAMRKVPTWDGYCMLVVTEPWFAVCGVCGIRLGRLSCLTV